MHFSGREEMPVHEKHAPKSPGSVRDLNRERFQEEVARELGVDLSPADHVPARESQADAPGSEESARGSDVTE